jgi:tight adherence protein C
MSALGTFLVATLVGACVFGLAMSLRAFFMPDRSMAKRIANLSTGGSAGVMAPNPVVGRFAERLTQLAAPASEPERNQMRQRLIQGGFRSKANLERFLVLRTMAALACPLLALLTVRDLSVQSTLFMVLAAASVGYYFPALLLDWRVNRRRALLLRPFPDALDLLVCCVEAGLGLDAAFRRVADEMHTAAPELSGEMQFVNNEIAAGVPRLEAFRHLDTRTGLSEMNALVGVLIQADRFGTSVAKALRIHAELVRAKRMLSAEERAAKASPKLTVVMILFILPSLVLVLIGPAIINIARNLWPTLTGVGGG